MSEADDLIPPFENAILSCLSEEEYHRLAPHMEKVLLKAETVLHEIGAPAQPVYFLEDGVGSEILSDENGDTLGLSVIGNEGLMGERAIFGRLALAEFRCVMFTDATAWKMPPQVLREEFKRGGVFQDLVLGSIEARIIEASQNALCALYHSAEQRFNRWLLILAYRSHRNTFHVTQEHISHMLGIRRATVTGIMGGMREAGAIETSRGTLTILDHEALEMGACKCYEVLKKATHTPLTP